MPRTRYLNVVLTANAVLLSALLWTQIADRPLLADAAQAQSSRQYAPPNSAQLMKKTLDEIASMKKQLDAIDKTLKSGKVRVEVTNLGDIQINADQD